MARPAGVRCSSGSLRSRGGKLYSYQAFQISIYNNKLVWVNQIVNIRFIDIKLSTPTKGLGYICIKLIKFIQKC